MFIIMVWFYSLLRCYNTPNVMLISEIQLTQRIFYIKSFRNQSLTYMSVFQTEQARLFNMIAICVSIK
jgi:hypothetical protein